MLIWWIFIWAVKSLKICTLSIFGFNNHIRNSVMLEVKIMKISTLMGSFCPNYITFQLKNYTGVMCYDTEEWCKIWCWLFASKMAWGIWKILTQTLKSPKILTLMVSFCPKYLMCELKSYREFICHDMEFSFQHYKVWKFELWWDSFPQST